MMDTRYGPDALQDDGGVGYRDLEQSTETKSRLVPSLVKAVNPAGPHKGK